MPLWKVYLHLLSLLLLLLCAQSSHGKGKEVKGVLGGEAKLPCKVDSENCGEIFSITWVKQIKSEWKRVYFMDGGTFEKALQVLDFAERAKYVSNNSSAHLVISSLRLEDEGIYRCDVTYTVSCPSLTFSSLVILVQPTQPEIKKDDNVLGSDSEIRPDFNEGEELTLTCETKNGKPTAEVLWLKDGDPIESKISTTEGSDGSEVVKATIKFNLTREDSGTILTCQVVNEALEEPLETWVKIVLRLKPLSMNASGPTKPVKEGDTIELTCVVEGARPAAEISWYNRSEIFHSPSEPHAVEMEDGTFRTSSELEVVVSRYDHEGTFYCKGTNEVLKDLEEESLMQSLHIKVEYPPIVIIKPEGGMVVNESSDAMLSCWFNANPRKVSDIVWYKDFEVLDHEDNDNYSTSFDKEPILTIHDVRREERGVYMCGLRNRIGAANSSNSIEIIVLYSPTVKAVVTPEKVDEGEESTVSLDCKIEKGNPKNLLYVRWYKNGEFFSETTENSISWVGITRDLAANYSCDARNEAGWGEISDPDELIVRYLPGEADIIKEDAPAVKGEATVLLCDVKELGFPEADTYVWELDGKEIEDQDDANYTIEEVEFDSQGNYSCYAKNIVGFGPKDYHYLDAKAPPSFIAAPRKDEGAARYATEYNITCHVECDPICDIEWFKNEESIMDSDLYDIIAEVLDEDDNRDVFSSVKSTLRWNMSAWPGKMFDRERDTANYTCKSTDNEVGEGVEATTLFSVEYAPENIRVTQEAIIVEEGEMVDPIICSASSWPQSTYLWIFGDLIVSDTPTLSLEDVNRTEAGIYVCMASNIRGHAKIEVLVEVLHAPECALTREEEGNQIVLICEGNANPEVVNFTWTKDGIEVEDDVDTENLRSEYKFSKLSVEYYGEYECVVRNSIGESEPCGLNITVAIAAPWDPATGEKKVFIIAAVVGGIAILFLLIAVVIITLMRRKRSRVILKSGLEDMNSESQHQSVIGKQQVRLTVQTNGSPVIRGTTAVATLKRMEDRRRRLRTIADVSATKSPKPSEAVYQNIESADPKENGLSEPETKPMYENMPFFGRNKGTTTTNPPAVLYADLSLSHAKSRAPISRDHLVEYAKLNFDKDRNGSERSIPSGHQ